ncbi:hypothetical protein Pcinc_003701 [Petrolisthes cinctipes]|uniref:Uncharacterized protein n=1 Tax=Petrolisthes cinctipes TaxID=88211 RepID=A0AAE1GFW8_PETCI|nr:hypothetical protein Pcinc_003701 [Petrolisthes cinctipes]
MTAVPGIVLTVTKHGAKNLRLQVIAIQQENKPIKSALENLTAQCSHNAGDITQLNNIVKDTNAKLTEMEKTLDSRLTGIETALSKPPAQAQDQTYLEALENKLDSVDKKTATTIQALEQKVSNISSKDLVGPVSVRKSTPGN